jgi:hypothetical protein
MEKFHRSPIFRSGLKELSQSSQFSWNSQAISVTPMSAKWSLKPDLFSVYVTVARSCGIVVSTVSCSQSAGFMSLPVDLRSVRRVFG